LPSIRQVNASSGMAGKRRNHLKKKEKKGEGHLFLEWGYAQLFGQAISGQQSESGHDAGAGKYDYEIEGRGNANKKNLAN